MESPKRSAAHAWAPHSLVGKWTCSLNSRHPPRKTITLGQGSMLQSQVRGGLHSTPSKFENYGLLNSFTVLELKVAFFCIPPLPDSQYHFSFEWANPDTVMPWMPPLCVLIKFKPRVPTEEEWNEWKNWAKNCPAIFKNGITWGYRKASSKAGLRAII